MKTTEKKPAARKAGAKAAAKKELAAKRASASVLQPAAAPEKPVPAAEEKPAEKAAAVKEKPAEKAPAVKEKPAEKSAAVKEKAVRTATAEWAEWAAIMMRAKKVSMVEVVRSELTWVLPQSIYKPENFINLTVKFP